MSKKNSESKPAEATTATATVDIENKAPVDIGTKPAVALDRFNLALAEQVKSYLASGGSDTNLGAFVDWSQSHPPVSRAGNPSHDSVTGQVWAYCDSLVKEGKVFTRKDVIEALVNKGFNRATAQTQFQRWTKARGYGRPAPVYGAKA